MAEVHITEDGLYQMCQLVAADCDAMHLPGVSTVTEALALPHLFLEQLLGAVEHSGMRTYQPGSVLDGLLGLANRQVEAPTRVWRNSNGHRHRGYDLPAYIEGDYLRVWYRHSLVERGNDLPALINTRADLKIWMQRDRYHRAGGKPAIINGYQHYWFEDGIPTRPGLMIIPGVEPYEIDPPRLS